MRKAAVEALVLVGIDKITIFDFLKDLPEDLKDVFYNLAFSGTANKETKESIIFAAAANDSPQLREEVSSRILLSPDPDLIVLIEENLKKENLKNENDGETLVGGIRANYADMLASKQGSAASQIFISVLKTADPSFQVGLVDRLVNHLIEWNISGPEYEDLLIEQLHKLRIKQVRGSLTRSIMGNAFKKKWGWEPDPTTQIVTALSQAGEKKALAAMIEVLLEEAEDPRTSFEKGVSDSLALRTAWDSTQLGSATMRLFQRLNDSGQLPPLGNVAEADLFRVLLEKLKEN
jgi:hypothetical protein